MRHSTNDAAKVGILLDMGKRCGEELLNGMKDFAEMYVQMRRNRHKMQNYLQMS